MNVVKKLTLQTLKANKRRTIVTIIGIILSVSMVTAVFISIPSFFHAEKQNELLLSGGWHALVFDVQEEYVEEITSKENINRYGISQDQGFGQLDNERLVYFIGADGKHMDLSATELTEGRYPQTSKEIAIQAEMNQYYDTNYQVGDTIEIKRGKVYREEDGEEISYRHRFSEDVFKEEKTETYTITGILKQRYAAADINYTFSDFSVYTILDQNQENKKYDMTVEFKDASKIADFNNEIVQEYPDSNITIKFHYTLLHMNIHNLSQDTVAVIIGLVCIVLSIIIIGSVAVIYNAFSISLSQRSRMLGMLTSVGATKKQKYESVMFEALIIGITAIPLGIAAGFLGMYVTFKCISPLLQEVMGIQAPITVCADLKSIVWIIIISIFIIVISAWVPAKRASKIGPIQAIRQNADYKITRKTIKTSKLTRKIFGIEGELALKNIKRNKPRYRSTLISLIISIVLVLTTIFFNQYITKIIHMDVEMLPYDISIQEYYSINEQSLEEVIKQKELDYKEISTIQHYKEKGYQIEGWAESKFVMDYYSEKYKPLVDDMLDTTETITLVFLKEKEYQQFLKETGLKSSSINGGIVYNIVEYTLDNKKIEIPKYKLDGLSEIKLAAEVNSYIDEVDGLETRVYEYEEYSLPISTVINKKTPQKQRFDNLNDIEIIFPESYLEPYFNSMPLNSTRYKGFTGTQYYDVNENTYLEMKKELNELGYAYRDLYEMTKSTQQLVFIVDVFLYGFITLLVLICISNIFNTITTGIALRSNEFAMLQSIGITPKGFKKMITYESMFYAIKSLLYGLPVAIMIHIGIYYYIHESYVFAYEFPFVSIFIVALCICWMLWLTSLYSKRIVCKESIVDTIRKESI